MSLYSRINGAAHVFYKQKLHNRNEENKHAVKIKIIVNNKRLIMRRNVYLYEEKE